MSQENIDIVKRLYEEWGRGDYDDREPFAEDLEFEMSGSVWIQPEPVTARGVDGMTGVWRRVLGDWEDFRAGPIDELIELGDDRIVVLNRLIARGRQTGIEVEASRGAIFTFAGGKIKHLLLADREEALRAAGLNDEGRP